MTSRGEVVELGDKAEKYRDQKETIKRLERELADSQGTVTTLRDEIERAKRPGDTAAKRKRFLVA